MTWTESTVWPELGIRPRAEGGLGMRRDRGVRRALGADGERGAGTVLVLGLVAVVIVLTAGLAALTRAQSARAAAQTAADLSALAAATSVWSPPGVTVAPSARTGPTGCVLASEVAQRNGGTVAVCTEGADGVVDVTVTADRAVGRATATARAGPASARGP